MNLLNFPFLVFAVSFVVLSLSAQAGIILSNRLRPLETEERHDFGVVLGALLTLLGLLIGFTFSMAITRYDQRKNYEEAEANAIGTEYVRADLLPVGSAARLRELLKKYADERVQFYTTRDPHVLAKIDEETAELQSELWSAARSGSPQGTAVVALVLSGMNDVLNSQGYTQAAWWNRIPPVAWVLMAVVAMYCNLLVGHVAHRTNRRLFLILPLAVSISFFLISDIDSPRSGLIHVSPQNLLSLSHLLHASSADADGLAPH
jgi:hypothetical protein